MRTYTDKETPHGGARFRKPLKRSDPLLMKQWTHLWRDEFVEISRKGRETSAGWVDDISRDGTTIWINLTAGRGRIMIHVDDEVDIWRVDARISQYRRSANPLGLTLG